MREISYKVLFIGSFTSLINILKKYYIAVFALAAVQCLCKLAMYFLFRHSVNQSYYFLGYQFFFKPLFLLILFGFLWSYFQKKKHDTKIIYADIKRCYLKFFILHTVISLFVFYVSGAGILLYMIIFLKFPFVEAMMYFHNTSIMDAIKKNYEEIDGKMLRYMMILLFLFMVVRFFSLQFLQSFRLTGYMVDAMLVLGEFIGAVLLMLYYSYLVCLFKVVVQEKAIDCSDNVYLEGKKC